MRSTSKVGPFKRIDQLSRRERNKIEKLAQKRGRVYVLDIWDGGLAFVVLPEGEWVAAEEWRAREEQRESEEIRTGSWLRDAMGEERWSGLTSDGDD